MDYIVTTPSNPRYNGKTYGVQFRAGRAFVSPHTIDPTLGWSVEEVVRKMQDDFGYEVEPVGNSVAAANDTPRRKRTKAGASVAPEVSA